MESPAETTWKGFSLADRDRRWQRVRDSAAKADFDCIFVPLCVDGRNLHLSLEQARGTRSDCRYLTQMENSAIALPTEAILCRDLVRILIMLVPFNRFALGDGNHTMRAFE